MSQSEDDDTKKLLQQMLSDLHAKQASAPHTPSRSYLQAADGTFLGNINTNSYDRDSFANPYGPYGSRYSQTSVLNPYSPYGSPYGADSINNPYTLTPPKLFLDGKLVGRVSANPRVADQIPADLFIEALRSNIPSILDLSFLSGKAARAKRRETWLEASDGTFLGNLNPSPYNSESIFNRYGAHGSRYSPTSIFNSFGTYGSPYSNLSPYNQFSTTPPVIYVAGRAGPKVTKNKFISNAVDPDGLLSWAEKNVRRW